jgi:SPP1 gp7 family putative phage head morphogenesis protein
VYAAVAGFKAGLAAREGHLMALMARRWVGVQDRLLADMTKLAQELAAKQAAGEVITEAKLWQMNRYQSLLAQSRREVKTYARWADATIQGEQKTIGLVAQRQAGAAINQWGVAGTFDRLNPAAIRDMVGLTADGSPLLDLLTASWPNSVDQMTKALLNGTAQGWNPRKTARAMADGTDTSLNRMMTIARTEQIRVYRTSSLERYRESGVVAGFRRLAAKQERTCMACLIEDGRYYSLDEADEFEDHINGRCAMVPITQGHQGDDPGVTSGREWFEGLDDEAQQRIMGAEKWQAWQDGEFGLDDMVKRTRDDTWGTSLGMRSLEELQND